MISRIKRFFGLNGKADPGEKSRFAKRHAYVAADDTRMREKHWADANASDANSALIPELATIRQRARFEMRNNPYLRGMASTWPNYVIGEGPRLRLRTDEAAFNRTVESAFNGWARRCDASNRFSLGRLLWLGEYEMFPDGEYFWSMIFKPSGSGVALRLAQIEPDRVDTPWGLTLTTDLVSGIKLDPEGEPLLYYVWKNHPGNTLTAPIGLAGEYSEIPARFMIHSAAITRPGQARGEPLICANLTLFADYRRFRGATINNAEISALFAAFLESTNQNVESSDIGDVVMDIEPGTVSSIPKGWKVSQVKPEHPSNTYKDFKRDILAEAGAGVNMPYNVAAQDSSNHTYSSGRLDWQVFHRAIVRRRSDIESDVLAKVLSVFMERWGEVNGIPQKKILAAVDKSSWLWPGFEQIDRVKEATADQIEMQNGLVTMAELLARKGKDLEAHVEEKKYEKKLLADAGLDFPPAAAIAAPFGPDSDEDEKPPKEDGKPPKEEDKKGFRARQQRLYSLLLAAAMGDE